MIRSYIFLMHQHLAITVLSQISSSIPTISQKKTIDQSVAKIFQKNASLESTLIRFLNQKPLSVLRFN